MRIESGRGNLLDERDEFVSEVIYQLDFVQRRISANVMGAPYNVSKNLPDDVSGTITLLSPAPLRLNQVLKLQIETGENRLVIVVDRFSQIQYRIAATAG